MLVNLKRSEKARCFSSSLQKLEPKTWYLVTPMDHHHHHQDHHYRHRRHHHHHHHHQANKQLGDLLTCSGLTCLEVSLMVSHGSFCHLVWSLLVFSVTYYGALCSYGATNFLCITVFCPKLGLYLVLLQPIFLFYILSRCILLFFSYVSFLLLLFFLRLLL